MVLPRDFADAERAADALARRTSLGVGGRPRFLFEPESQEACTHVVRLCHAAGVPLRVLGGGCNLIVDDDALEGAVVATRRLKYLRVYDDRVGVGAGNGFPDLVRRSISLGIPGLPGCPGIPGSVGGVVCMNAGGRFGSVADALVEVAGLDCEGNPFRRFVQEGELGYRSSPFTDCVVTGATFRRDPDQTPEQGAALFRKALAWKRETQPLSARSAGCIFKNPDGPRSAGWLIEHSDLKGRRIGGAMVSTQHANFIVNTGAATARDVRALIELVQAEVRRLHGIALETEVRIWTQEPVPGARPWRACDPGQPPG